MRDVRHFNAFWFVAGMFVMLVVRLFGP